MRALGALLCLIALPAAAQDWRIANGERRASFGAWIVSCADEGRGSCRAVSSGADPGSAAFFDYRLALHPTGGAEGGAVIEVMDRTLAATGLERLIFAFDDGEAVEVPQGAWRPGDVSSRNVADTVLIENEGLAARLMDAMRRGTGVTIVHLTASDGGSARFSLDGVTAALGAIPGADQTTQGDSR